MVAVDELNKHKMKTYAGKRRNTASCDIGEGDKVLVKQCGTKDTRVLVSLVRLIGASLVRHFSQILKER